MPITDPKNTHVNAPLTDLSVAHFDTEIANYVSPRIAPHVKFRHLADLYYLYDQGDLNRIEMALRASGAEADQAGYDLTTATVALERFALQKPTGFDEQYNADEVLDIDRSDMDYLLMQWLLRMDERCSARLFGAGLWTGSTTGADLVAGNMLAGAWDVALSRPVEDIHQQRESIKLRTGMKLLNKNFKLVVGSNVWSILRVHPQIEALYTGVQVGILNTQKVAEAMDIGEIIIADTIQNTAPEGVPAVNAYLFNARHALLIYTAPNPGKKVFSAAYTFCGGHRPGLSPYGHQMKTWDDEKMDAHVNEINAWFRHAIVSANGAAKFSNIVA